MPAGGEDLVQVAWANDELEAEVIGGLLKSAGILSVQQQVGVNGPQLGYVLSPGGGSRRILVHPDHLEAANAILVENRVADEYEAPEPVNARYLDEAQGRRGPRNYGLIGAYLRIFAVSVAAMALMALAFVVYSLLRDAGLV
ncbi:MAG TPA: DUF2007 domain-containing protein [Solirubrobacterales bacterium]|nr:DUF2007 domain-containing protein [Solirubrobacterales bacterium]